MKITRLLVRMGDHEVSIIDCTDGDADVAELIRTATSSSSVITIEVSQSDEAAAALGRLIFGRPNTARGRSATDAADRIAVLSKRVDAIGLFPRSVRCLKAAGVLYIWQVVEKTERTICRIKGIGHGSMSDIERVLLELELELEMDLSSIKDRLPQPPG